MAGGILLTTISLSPALFYNCAEAASYSSKEPVKEYIVQPGDSLQAGQSTPTETKAPEVKEITYKVVAGDSLSKIAKNFNTTVQDIKTLNKLKSDTIYIGQTFYFHLPPFVGNYYNYQLTVKTVHLTNPQPTPQEPKEPPKDEKPKEQQPKPQNPQTPPKSQQPKQEEPKDNKPSSPKTETPKTGNQSGGNTGGQSGSQPGSKKSPSEIKPNPSNSGSSGENKDFNPNVGEGNKKLPDSEEVASWTTEEMKEKGAIVEKVDGKYFATIDGVKKEITKQQAQELGFEETDGKL